MLATLLLGVYLFYILTKNDCKKKYIYLLSVTAIMEVVNMRGYFIPTGDESGVSRSFVCELLLFFYSIYYIKFKKLSLNSWMIAFSYLFLLFAAIGVVYEFAIPYENPIIDHLNKLSWDGYAYGLTNKTPAKVYWPWSMFMLFKLYMVLVQLVIIKSIITYENLLLLLRLMDKFIRYAIIYAVFETICKVAFDLTIISDYVSIIILGVHDYEGMRADSYALVGVGGEPSTLARYLFFALLLSCFRKKYDSKYSKREFIITNFTAIVLMLLGHSMASLWLLVMYFVFAFIIKNNDHKTNYIKVFKITFLLVIFMSVTIILLTNWLETSDSYAAYRLNRILYTLDYLSSGVLVGYQYGGESSLARLGSIYDVFYDFMCRPVFGLGAGVETSHGGLSSFLSEYGLIGLFLWIGLTFHRTRVYRINAFFFIIWFFMMNLPLRMGVIPYEIYPLLVMEFTCLPNGIKLENEKCLV